MNISNWPIGQIMQLPEWLFGRRWCVSCCGLGTPVGPGWDISELALPERGVIWEYAAWLSAAAKDLDDFRVAYGDQLPTSNAEMMELEPVFPGIGNDGPEPRAQCLTSGAGVWLSRIKMPIVPAGRRLVIEVNAAVGSTARLAVVIIVSSMPTEIPDCLISV